MPLNLNSRITAELPADPETRNFLRQVTGAIYSFVEPTPAPAPKLAIVAEDLVADLGFTPEELATQDFLHLVSGNRTLPNAQPYAFCYGGHQFGHWAGQLGDGRAINIAEVTGADGKHWALQLKGSGLTPYSRSADGLAVMRSSLREFVCSEAMHHLGIPTTRALSLVSTGQQVMRDKLYNGNAELEPGAVVCRVAESFLRFGNYQILASRKETDLLRQLVEFTITHHFSDVAAAHKDDETARILAFFDAVCERTCDMIVEWMRVGFVHGVMNTDNLSILGLTIDYGPYGWLDDFDPDWTPNTTDAGQKRYRYSQQPSIALWNLLQLANALFPLVEDAAALEASLHAFQERYQSRWQRMMANKLGLELKGGALNRDQQDLIERIEPLLTRVETDMTIFYRTLSEQDIASPKGLKDAFYSPETLSNEDKNAWQLWLDDYNVAISAQASSADERRSAMQRANPKYVFRNYLAQLAIDDAEQGNYDELHTLMNVLKTPYTVQEGAERFAEKRPDWARTRVGCSMLSCSS